MERLLDAAAAASHAGPRFFVLGEVAAAHPGTRARDCRRAARGRLPRRPARRRQPPDAGANSAPTSVAPRRGSKTSSASRSSAIARRTSRSVRPGVGLRDPARGGIPLRLEPAPDPPRPVRPARRAALPVRDLARRRLEPDRVPDRHRAAAGREPADRRRRVTSGCCRSRVVRLRHPARQRCARSSR